MTTFSSPLKTGQVTGDPTTDTTAYADVMKQVNLDAVAGTRKIITLPPKSTLLTLSALIVSAISGVDTAASAMSVNFGNSADPTHYGTFQVSAGGKYKFFSNVSANDDFDNGGTIICTLSALSTTTFTAGGVRGFIRYVTSE